MSEKTTLSPSLSPSLSITHSLSLRLSLFLSLSDRTVCAQEAARTLRLVSLRGAGERRGSGCSDVAAMAEVVLVYSWTSGACW